MKTPFYIFLTLALLCGQATAAQSALDAPEVAFAFDDVSALSATNPLNSNKLITLNEEQMQETEGEFALSISLGAIGAIINAGFYAATTKDFTYTGFGLAIVEGALDGVAVSSGFGTVVTVTKYGRRLVQVTQLVSKPARAKAKKELKKDVGAFVTKYVKDNHEGSPADTIKEIHEKLEEARAGEKAHVRGNSGNGNNAPIIKKVSTASSSKTTSSSSRSNQGNSQSGSSSGTRNDPGKVGLLLETARLTGNNYYTHVFSQTTKNSSGVDQGKDPDPYLIRVKTESSSKNRSNENRSSESRSSRSGSSGGGNRGGSGPGSPSDDKKTGKPPTSEK